MDIQFPRTVVKQKTVVTKKGVECQLMEFFHADHKYTVFLPIHPDENGVIPSPFVTAAVDQRQQAATELAQLKAEMAELRRTLNPRR